MCVCVCADHDYVCDLGFCSCLLLLETLCALCYMFPMDVGKAENLLAAAGTGAANDDDVDAEDDGDASNNNSISNMSSESCNCCSIQLKSMLKVVSVHVAFIFFYCSVYWVRVIV